MYVFAWPWWWRSDGAVTGTIAYGDKVNRPLDSIALWDRVKALFGHGFGHQRLIKDAYPGLMHLLIFSAFVVEFIGTALIALQVDLGRVFLWGDFYLYYSLVLDIFGGLGHHWPRHGGGAALHP